MVGEPSPRKDGLCVQCQTSEVPRSATKYADADAFCSSRCCRAYFGTELEIDESPAGGKVKKQPAKEEE